MVASNEEPFDGSDAGRRCTQPLVNHPYQGMALDAATGL